MCRILFFLLLFAAVAIAPARADVLVLPCVRDNTLFADENGGTSNGSGPAIFSGRNGTGRTTRALVAFELPQAALLDARIDDVTLTLVVTSAGDTAASTITVHRVTRAWGEGASSSATGTGAPAAPGDATWLHAFYPADPWSAPGGDFEATASAATSCTASGPNLWGGTGLVADVEAWLADPSSNHGWLLLGVETGLRTVRRFGSREAPLGEERPTLTIQFTVQPVEAAPRSWGRLKAAYR